MSNLPIIEAAKDELTAIFKDLHQHPEIGFTEHRTAGVVAEKLEESMALTRCIPALQGQAW